MKKMFFYSILSVVLLASPMVYAATEVEQNVFEVNLVEVHEAAQIDLAVAKPRRSISQRISDSFEKARRNREGRKQIREQHKREEQRKKQSEEKPTGKKENPAI